MKEIKILCWNVNGIRAIKGKGFLEWLYRENPDIICLQETKAHPDQLDLTLRQPESYHTCWSAPEKKGYSGVATFSKEQPVTVIYGIGLQEFDGEGRVVATEYPQFILFNVYFPNGKKDDSRLKYKLDFYHAFLQYVEPLRKQDKKIIVCGDFNTAHAEIDLARPKENERVSGFLPVERAWMDTLVSQGWLDTFRHFNKEPRQYTWWDLKSGARERNVGWRIDYMFITKNLLPSLSGAFIMPEVMGSDHCPIGVKLKT